jgi:hypothetical protein
MAQTEASQIAALKAGFKKPMIITADLWKGKNNAYLGPRKTDDSPQASFNYGDGTYVIQFHYSKDDKSDERSGISASRANPKDAPKPETFNVDVDDFVASMV